MLRCNGPSTSTETATTHSPRSQDTAKSAARRRTRPAQVKNTARSNSAKEHGEGSGRPKVDEEVEGDTVLYYEEGEGDAADDEVDDAAADEGDEEEVEQTKQEDLCLSLCTRCGHGGHPDCLRLYINGRGQQPESTPSDEELDAYTLRLRRQSSNNNSNKRPIQVLCIPLFPSSPKCKVSSLSLFCM